MDVVFLDANILFSAAYRTDAGVRELWRLSETTLTTSPYAIEEARRNLEVGRRGGLERLLKKVELVADVAPDERVAAVELVRSGLPGKDVPILLAAVRSGATHLLTGDFKHFGPYYGEAVEGVLVMPPADYLRFRNPKGV